MGVWRQLAQAWRGSAQWKSLRSRYDINKTDIVVFLVEQDEELNEYAFKYAGDLMQLKHQSRMFMITPYEDVLDRIPDLNGSVIKVGISPGQCDGIKKYYQLVRFSGSAYFISATWPESNWAEHILGRHDVDKEDLVCLGIYALRILPGKEEKREWFTKAGEDEPENISGT